MVGYDGRQVVVGAAILAGDPPYQRVLATCRSAPPSLAGMWEFPGGKVEPDESEIGALVRECEEELGLTLDVGERLGDDVLTVDGEMTLRVYVAQVVTGELSLSEHSAARWLSYDELDDVPWIPTDRPVVESLRALMRPESR